MSKATLTGLKICFRCRIHLSSTEATAILRSKRFASSSSSTLATTDTHSKHIANGHNKERKLLKKVRPVGKLRGLNGHLTRQGIANLETEALGEPAKVIILRDAMLDDSRSFVDGTYINDANQDLESTAGETPAIENLTVTKLLAKVEEERGLISQEDVNTNIEALRPQSPSVLSQGDFSTLADELCRGFTSAQLAGYIHALETKRRPNGSTLEKKEPINLEQTEWTPRATPKIKSRREKSAAVRAVPKKRRYAEHVLRRCWSIQTEEEYESIGQMDLLLGHGELSLLLRERSSLMQRFSETYNCQINISRSHRIVRITGRRYDAQNLVLALRKMVGSVACAEFNMAPFLPLREGIAGGDMIEKPTIEAISQATDTEIEPGEDRNKFNIYFWNWKTPNLEKARRLLLARLELPSRTKSAVFMDNESAKGLLGLCRTELGIELPLNDRSIQWSRWRFGSAKGDVIPQPDGNPIGDDKPSTKINRDSVVKSDKSIATRMWAFLQPEEPENRDNSEAIEIVDHKSVPAQANASEQNSQSSGKKENQQLPAMWSVHPVSSIYAKLGQILHNTDGLSPVQPGEVKNLLSKNADRRLFLTGLPGLPNLLCNMKPLETVSKQYLAMRLVPSPWMSSSLESITRFPHVEICVQINEDTGEPQLPVVQAVVEENIADLMLPDRPADLRFTKQAKVTLLKPLLDEKIKEFVKSGELRADGIRPSGSPTTVELRIPKRLVLGDSTPDFELVDDGGEECVLVQYILVGLDMQQSVRFNYNGWEVTYSDINSGKVRGRRMELLMTMARSASEADIPNSELLSDFPTFFDDARRLVAEFEGSSRERLQTVLGDKGLADAVQLSSVWRPDHVRTKPAQANGMYEMGQGDWM